MKPIKIILGEERFLVRRELENIKKNNPQSEAVVMDGVSAAELLEKIMVPSLFASQAVYFAHNFDFSGGNENFFRSLNSLPMNVILIFVFPQNLDRRTKSFKLISANTETMEFKKIPEWEAEKLCEWIISQASSAGKKISNACAGLLVDYCGFDMGTIAGEIEKLAVYIGDRKEISKEDIETMVVKTGFDAFSLANAMKEKNRKKSFEALQKLINDREDPISLLGLISYQFRNMLKIKILKSKRLDNYEIAKQIKSSPYAVAKMTASVDKFSETELESGINALFNADIKLKSGYDFKVELPLLLLELLR